jgi:replicative DNA helicase
MNRSDAAREVKSRYAEYLQPAKKRIAGKPTYICPLCGNGSGKDGDGMSVDPHGDGTQLKCFKCGFYGDIVDLYQQQNACDVGAAFTALYDRFDITIENDRAERSQTATNSTGGINIPPAQEKPAESPTEAAEGKPDFTDYYKRCKEHINDDAAQAYLTFRGLSNDTAARYWLGYDPATGYLIIPAAKSFFIARNTDSAAKMRYRNPTGVSIELFNLKALYNDAARPVFITEGAIDALSIIEAGGEAVALNSTSNTRKLLEQISKQRTRSTLILCLDTDDAGKKAAATLAEGLRELNIAYVTADICGQHKDPNEALTTGRAAFIEAVAAAERGTTKPDNIGDYIRHSMAAEIEGLRAQSDRKTGFYNLDAEAGSIYAGLYAVGGISSVGKTTFISQIADQMAEQGQHVLFFSMEQSRLEMVSKSIARQTAKDDPDKAVSSLQIRTGAKGESIARATAEYLQSVGDRISIIEGNFNCTVGYISNYTKAYIAKNGGVKPVIVVDYLQVLKAEKDPETGRKMTDTKQIVDHNITELKRLSRSLELPIFVISSLNRSNYLTPVDFEAFKESGGVEYTSDCVWGLQLAAIHDPVFDREGKIKEKREKIAEAKEAMPREIELVCLKNRYGKSRYAVQFTYYPQYDYFAPVGGFMPVIGKTPFDK